METCSSCKHWKRENSIFGTCQTITSGIYGIAQISLHNDAPGTDADFDTAEDFGCNQHEPKENEDGK